MATVILFPRNRIVRTLDSEPPRMNKAVADRFVQAVLDHMYERRGPKRPDKTTRCDDPEGRGGAA